MTRETRPTSDAPGRGPPRHAEPARHALPHARRPRQARAGLGEGLARQGNHAMLDAEGGYGRCVRVDLLHKLHDELKYPTLDALRDGIARDTAEARAWFGALPG